MLEHVLMGFLKEALPKNLGVSTHINDVDNNITRLLYLRDSKIKMFQCKSLSSLGVSILLSTSSILKYYMYYKININIVRAYRDYTRYTPSSESKIIE